MEILKQKGDLKTQKERSSNDNLAYFDGSIIEDNLDNICNLCYESVSKEIFPQMVRKIFNQISRFIICRTTIN